MGDFWVMRADGSGKRRLTHFNDPEHPQAISEGVVAGDCEWSPDDAWLAGYLILKAGYQERERGDQRTRLVRIPIETGDLPAPE